MTEMFRYYARCNAAIDDRMLLAVGRAGPGAFDREVKAYFKSVGEILEHVYKGDLFWLSRIGAAKAFLSLPAKAVALPSPEARILRSLEACSRLRAALDSTLLALTEELAAGDLDLAVSMPERDGKILSWPLWKVLMQVFNHQTHHRGQISQILDEWGVENDYSVMLKIE